MAQREWFYPSPENEKFIARMAEKNISKSSLINLALDVLKPRINNINTTETAISETLMKKTIEEHLEY